MLKESEILERSDILPPTPQPCCRPNCVVKKVDLNEISRPGPDVRHVEGPGAVTERCGRLALLRGKASCLSEGILTVYIGISKFFFILFIRVLKVHSCPRSAFCWLYYSISKKEKMTIISINIIFAS